MAGPDDDEFTVYGEFHDAMSRGLDEAAIAAANLKRELEETGAAGVVAAGGLDRASSAAGRYQAQAKAVDSALERNRLAQLNLMAAEEAANKIRAKGVLSAQDTARVENMTTSARRDAERAARDLTRAQTDLARATENLGMRLLRTAGSVTMLERAFSALKLVATVEMFTSLIAGVSSLGAAAVAAVGGLAPLLGLAGGLPALGIAAMSVAGSLKLLVGNLGQTVKMMTQTGMSSPQVQQALMHMGPAAQRAAYELYGFSQAWVQVRNSVQAAGLRYLPTTLNNVRSLLPTVQKGLSGVAGAVGHTVLDLSQKLRQWQPDIQTLMTRNTRLVTTLGHAGIAGAGILKDIALDAGGMVQGLSQHLLSGLRSLESWFNNNPGKVTGFFNGVKRLTLEVLSALRDLGGGLIGVFKGATPLSNSLGTSLSDAFHTFNLWANSAGGQNRIRQFFTDAIPVVDSMGRLLMTVGHSLASLSSNNGMTGMLNQLNIILPPLTRLVELISKIPGGSTVFASMFLASRFGVSPGALAKGTFGAGRGISRFSRGARGVEVLDKRGNVPLAARLGNSVGGMFGGGGALAGGAEAGAGGAAATGGVVAGEELAPAAAPLLANPIGLAIVAAVALIGLGVVLYHKWKPFHDLVDKVGRGLMIAFNWVKDHAGRILSVVLLALGPIGWAIDIIWHHWQGFLNVTKDIARFFAPLGRLVATVLVDQFKVLRDIVVWIYDKFKWVIDHLHDIPGASTIGRFASSVGHFFGLYKGGAMVPGENYLLGERGPELLATASGMRVVGGDGAELMRATEPGFVLPNEALRAMIDAIPNPTVAAAAASRPELADVGGSYRAAPGGATVEATVGGGRPRTYQIIVQPHTELDVETMVRRAIRAIEIEEAGR